MHRRTQNRSGRSKPMQAKCPLLNVDRLSRRMRSRCEQIGGLKCGQPGVEIGGVDLYGNRQALFDLSI